MPLYADIVLPLAQPAYTFAVPEGMHVAEGTAVAVQFGPRKFYTGVVWRVHDRRPPFRTIKSIQRVLYDAPLLSAQQKALWEWIAAYYMCSAGEVMRVALPSLMKPSGDTEEEFAEDEFRPRTECYVALARELHDEGRLHEVFEKLGRRAPKQYEALLEIASAGDETRISTGEVARRLLRTDYAVLHALERKGHIVCTERERTVERGGSAFRLPELTAPQREALGSLREQFAEKPAALLHGVTGSGKTEIYIHLIAETLARGGDVLLLVPEIALTAQLIGRMERIFGSRVTPYHSKLTNRRRTETYLRLNRSQGGEFVVGVRSSIFLPLRHLQLIIVDEEHDASYKQADPAPRYNARDCAVVMARLWGGRTLLGSATPSLETWLNAEGGKYGRAVLAERYGDARPPEIFVSDTIRAAKRGERHAHFNKLLLDKMEETLGRGGQVMLFQNRRGFSPYVECSQCGWTARCPHCNVTLTYHKGGARLVCHYCGYTAPVPAKCPSCEVTEVLPRGFGTEKVEEEIARLFPEARVARLDRDSVTSERAFNAIISDFEARKTDILVGTQMITKGFDFGGVSLVGILNADNLLNNPDFRAAERAFQLMLQVAGRAGRRSDGGEVVIQTSEPGHPVIRQVVAGDFAGMARMQLSEREAFFYPPYARLTSLTLRHRDVALLRRGVTELAARLRVRFGRRVLGPMTPPVDRIRGEYLAGLLLKIESGASSAKARSLLAAELKAFAENPEFKTITVVCNVDPQ
ncbi:replication restart helicase PriA [Alistipes finegoldii]|uniref:replication restart helicase PriA n=1 Tax=Alistipes finegoldii TaxID=214856 RepID=UPI002491F2FC|nr:primosomal protein N' [Alistipes finegoldii]